MVFDVGITEGGVLGGEVEILSGGLGVASSGASKPAEIDSFRTGVENLSADTFEGEGAVLACVEGLSLVTLDSSESRP